MADTQWFLKGKWLEYCSCDWGCPCESMAPPTYGTCDGVVAMHIDEGYYGDVRLDGLNVVTTFFFPRALHHGEGQMQPFLDETSTPAQREAIFKILSGENQPVGTLFQIFSVVVSKVYDPQFVPIVFEWDLAQRTGRIEVPGMIRASTQPIRNPVTDKPHRVVTVLPEGWTFYECEGASGAAKSMGAIRFDFANRHSSLAPFAFDNAGMAYGYDEAKRKLGSRI